MIRSISIFTAALIGIQNFLGFVVCLFITITVFISWRSWRVEGFINCRGLFDWMSWLMNFFPIMWKKKDFWMKAFEFGRNFWDEFSNTPNKWGCHLNKDFWKESRSLYYLCAESNTSQVWNFALKIVQIVNIFPLKFKIEERLASLMLITAIT